MKLVPLLCGALLFLTGGAGVPAEAGEATACGIRCHNGATIGSYDSGFAAGLESGSSGIGDRRSSESRQGSLFQYDYHPCDGICRGLTDGAGAACTGAEQLVLVAVRDVTTASPWTLQGASECLTPAEQLPFDPAQLQATVDDYFQRIPLPLPGLRVSPADNAVVNLPEIVSADAPKQTTFSVNVAPFPTVTIKASVTWAWDFGDGESLTTSAPGRAYSVADTDLTHYLTHTYRKASPGWGLSVTAVWTATYTVAGLPGTRTVTGEVRRTSNRSLPAADYAGTLTGN